MISLEYRNGLGSIDTAFFLLLTYLHFRAICLSVVRSPRVQFSFGCAIIKCFLYNTCFLQTRTSFRRHLLCFYQVFLLDILIDALDCFGWGNQRTGSLFWFFIFFVFSIQVCSISIGQKVFYFLLIFVLDLVYLSQRNSFFSFTLIFVSFMLCDFIFRFWF